ncbi:hypothetical protein EYR41_008502 [Orbilia oligospora]|uniref:Uncharacterized protein n=2 Tax=Orbilia oligospora TaxID=2813651 RepID=A0A8H2DXY2_ORBOL|nr:hypothetical protein EYR41_008502 [Orbilia oligospora]
MPDPPGNEVSFFPFVHVYVCVHVCSKAQTRGLERFSIRFALPLRPSPMHVSRRRAARNLGNVPFPPSHGRTQPKRSKRRCDAEGFLSVQSMAVGPQLRQGKAQTPVHCTVYGVLKEGQYVHPVHATLHSLTRFTSFCIIQKKGGSFLTVSILPSCKIIKLLHFRDNTYMISSKDTFQLLTLIYNNPFNHIARQQSTTKLTGNIDDRETSKNRGPRIYSSNSGLNVQGPYYIHRGPASKKLGICRSYIFQTARRIHTI